MSSLYAFILFFPLFFIVRSLWLYQRNRNFETNFQWTLLEIVVPREITRSPRSMDQFFQAIAGMQNRAGHLEEKYLLGELPIQWTFEIVHLHGVTKLFMRVIKEYAHISKGALFAAYPELEIREVRDYIHELPESVLDAELQHKKIWGIELVTSKPPVYPLYTFIEQEQREEGRRIDRMALVLEQMNAIKGDEFCGMQITISPAPCGMRTKYKGIIEQLRTPKKISVNMSGKTLELYEQQSTHSNAILGSIERNFAKPLFYTTIRVMYVAPMKGWFLARPVSAIRSILFEHANADFNRLIPNMGTEVKYSPWDFPHIFAYTRFRARQERLLNSWGSRTHAIHEWAGRLLSSHPFNAWNSRVSILSSESLASLIHPPTVLVVTAPHIRREESKKIGAPAGLPIYGNKNH